MWNCTVSVVLGEVWIVVGTKESLSPRHGQSKKASWNRKSEHKKQEYRIIWKISQCPKVRYTEKWQG